MAFTLHNVECSTVSYDTALRCLAQTEHVQINDSFLFCADPTARFTHTRFVLFTDDKSL